MRTVTILTIGIALSAAAAIAQAPRPPVANAPDLKTLSPHVNPEGLKALSPHVQVIPDNSVSLVPNVGFVVGSRGVLVIDTGLGISNGRTVAAVAQRIAPGRAIYLLFTHAHPEHDLGAGGFPPRTTVIRSKAQQAEKDIDTGMIQWFAGFSPETARLLEGAEFRDADISFTDSYRLDLGGVEALISAHAPAHTGGDTVVWVPEDAVLFSGDLAMTLQPFPIAAQATPANWQRNLERLGALKPAVVVPAHGPISDAGLIAGYQSYFAEVAERTRAAMLADLSVDAVTELVWQAMRDRYPDRGRLGAAVRMVLKKSP